MRRSIVLEGPDGGGKSTALLGLSKALKMPMLHTGGPKSKSELEEMCTRTLALSRSEGFLFDRLPQISEQVYAPALKKPAIATDVWLLHSLMKIDPIIVYCRLKDWKEMFVRQSREEKAHKSSDHSRDVKSNYEDIVKRYDILMEDLKGYGLMTVIPYSWEDDSFQSLLTKIEEAA